MIQIFHEPEKHLTLKQERELARLAHLRAGSQATRLRQVRLAAQDDDYAEVVNLLDGVGDLGFGEQVMLTQAFLTFETEAMTARARETASDALAAADTAAQRAVALADQAKAERRLGKPGTARGLLESALSLDLHNKDACKRLAALDLEEGRSAELVSWSGQLVAAGAGHARLHAAHLLGEAANGNLDAARAVLGLPLLAHREMLSPPPGWSDLASFNAALAKELLGHRNLRYERYGSASNYTWRIDALARPDAPLVQVLLHELAARVRARVAELGGVDHRWLSDRPDEALLRAWCVITEGDGFESWHVHQFGWLSGVYYVQMPEGLVDPEDPAGCIGFGLPEEFVGDETSAQFGIDLVRPEPGLMLTFPSHAYHRTFPHSRAGRRICIAFDIKPA